MGCGASKFREADCWRDEPIPCPAPVAFSAESPFCHELREGPAQVRCGARPPCDVGFPKRRRKQSRGLEYEGLLVMDRSTNACFPEPRARDFCVAFTGDRRPGRHAGDFRFGFTGNRRATYWPSCFRRPRDRDSCPLHQPPEVLAVDLRPSRCFRNAVRGLTEHPRHVVAFEAPKELPSLITIAVCIASRDRGRGDHRASSRSDEGSRLAAGVELVQSVGRRSGLATWSDRFRSGFATREPRGGS